MEPSSEPAAAPHERKKPRAHPVVAELFCRLRRDPEGKLGFAEDDLAHAAETAQEIQDGRELYGLVGDWLRIVALVGDKLQNEPGAKAAMVALEPILERFYALAQREGGEALAKADAIKDAVRRQQDAIGTGPRTLGGLAPRPTAGVSLRGGKKR